MSLTKEFLELWSIPVKAAAHVAKEGVKECTRQLTTGWGEAAVHNFMGSKKKKHSGCKKKKR